MGAVEIAWTWLAQAHLQSHQNSKKVNHSKECEKQVMQNMLHRIEA